MGIRFLFLIFLLPAISFAYEDDYGICVVTLSGREPDRVMELSGAMLEPDCRRAAQVQLFMNSSHFNKVIFEIRPLPEMDE